MLRETQQFKLFAALAVSLLLWLSAPVLAQDETLTATVDRQEVSSNETLTLRVRYAGQVPSSQPDFSLLQEDFEIISRRRSNQISTINGTVSAFTEWTLTVAPKRTGKLLIPTFKLEDHYSDAIPITVTEPSSAPNELRDLYIETEVDAEAVDVQQQLLLTYRLYTTRSIDSMDVEALEIDGVRIEELPQIRFHRRINGRDYGVLEVRYALFPQSSENFTIPSVNWTLRILTDADHRSFGFGSGRYELKRIGTREQEIQVDGRPASFPSDQVWLPAKNVTLEEDWSSPPDEFEVGQPITRTLRLKAEGLTAAQLPPIVSGDAPAGVRFYPDRAEQDDRLEQTGVTGIRTERVAIVPSRGGEIQLPAIQVSWWDTESNQLRRAELPERTIVVKGDVGTTTQDAGSALAETPAEDAASGPTTASTSSESPGPGSLLWPLMAALFALLTLVFALLWWRQRRIPQVGESRATGKNREKQAFQELKNIASTGDLHALRAALLHWAGHRWSELPPRSLNELSRKVGAPAIEEQLMALDAQLYGGKTNTFEPEHLLRDLDAWRQQRPAPTQAGQQLRKLY